MNPYKKQGWRFGFTLIETMMASGILLMSTALVMSTTYTLQLSSKDEKVQNEMERDATIVLNYFNRDLNRASEVVEGENGYETSYSGVVMKIPMFDENEVMMSDMYTAVAYNYVWDGGFDEEQSVWTDSSHIERVEMIVEEGTPDITSHQVFDDVAWFYLQYDHSDFYYYQYEEQELSDVGNVEVYMGTRQERNGMVYYRDFVGSATIRNRF